MAYLHSVDFEKHINDFKEILRSEKTVVELNTTISDKLNEVKQTYQYLVKNNNKKIFLFCLESFFFQYKNHNTEYENLSKSSILIINRMYGDYYKLYNILLQQLREKNIPLKTISESKKFAIYKDLEPYHPYTIGEIIDVHNSIMEILFELQAYHNSLEKSAYNYSQTSNVGLSITNFIHTLQYENMLVREQIHLYVNYLSFFHGSHKVYLNKLINKIQTFQQEMEEDITNTNIQPFSQNIPIETVDLECVFAIAENASIDTILEDSDKIVKDSEEIIEKIEHLITNESITQESTDEVPPVLDTTESSTENEIQTIEATQSEPDDIKRIE